jgi:hypothetical protein
MRALTPTLSSAISAAGRQPAVQVRLADDKEHYALLRQDAPAKATLGCAACTAPNGNLVRAALFDNGGSGNADLAVQAISDPSQASQWTTWATLISAGAAADQPLALSANPGGVVRLFYADGPSDAAIIKVFESTNNGATWTGPSTVYSGTASYFFLASGGNDDLFATRNSAIGVWDVQFFKKSGGAWQPPLTWSLGALSSMDGLAAAWNGSTYFLAAAGWYSAGTAIEAYSFDGASTWADLNFVVPTDGSNLGFKYRLPSVQLVDGLYRLTYVEHDDGSVDGTPFDRYRLACSLDFTHWSCGVPASPQTLTSVFGAPFAKAFGSYYVTTPVYTFSWQVYTAGDATRNSDVSPQVLAYQRRETLLHASEVEVTISNQAGQFDTAPGLVRNGTLIVDEGYVTASGTEQVTVAMASIEHWFFRRSPGGSELVIVGRDVSRWLDDEAPLLLTYKNRTVLWLTIEVAARAGIFQLFWPSTPATGQTVASFAIQPGHSWREALHRLMEAYGLEYVVRADGSLVLHDPSQADTSAWTWQGELMSGQYATADLAANHVRVFSTGVQAEAWDYAAAEAAGLVRYRHVVDRMLATNAEAQIRAANELILEQRKLRGGEIVAPLNPGLEILDVMTVVDAGIGLNQTYRCQTITAMVDVAKGEFDMKIALVGV